MTVKDLEARCGIDRATIRYYEKEGLLHPTRRANGYRDYSEADAETLEKIALLRRLGLSIEDIRRIQSGELPLGLALEKQNELLRARQQETHQALHISQAIRRDGASYRTLQPEKYKAQLPPPAVGARPVLQDAPKHYATKHPWRRMFARELDHRLYLLPWTFLAASFGGVNSAGVVLFGWAASLISVLLFESLFLCTLGTTPGKWLMGLKLRRVCYDGPYKPDFTEALVRTAWVYFQGYGAGIGTVNLICAVLSYLRANRGEEQPWDEMWEYTAEEETRGSRVALFVAVLIALNLVGYGATQLQERRAAAMAEEFLATYEYSRDLTLQKYVENVNMILAENPAFESVKHISLDEQGKWRGKEEEQELLDRFRLLIYTERDSVVHIVCQTRWPAGEEGPRPDAVLLKTAAAMGLYEKADNRRMIQDWVESFWGTGIGWCVNDAWEIRQETETQTAGKGFFYTDEGWEPVKGAESVELFVKFTIIRRDTADDYYGIE